MKHEVQVRLGGVSVFLSMQVVVLNMAVRQTFEEGEMCKSRHCNMLSAYSRNRGVGGQHVMSRGGCRQSGR